MASRSSHKPPMRPTQMSSLKVSIVWAGGRGGQDRRLADGNDGGVLTKPLAGSNLTDARGSAVYIHPTERSIFTDWLLNFQDNTVLRCSSALIMESNEHWTVSRMKLHLRDSVCEELKTSAQVTLGTAADVEVVLENLVARNGRIGTVLAG